jgi:hypothetical protein
MKRIRRLHEFLARLNFAEKRDNSFTFPYSSDTNVKRQQIWDNLQKGILFEDRQCFLNWLTPFHQMDNYREERHDSGDRTLWYLGKRTVLDGYEGHFEVNKWVWLSWKTPVSEISENIGHDLDGNKKFLYMKEYITQLLGEPTKIELEKFGTFDLGVIQWQNGSVRLTLTAIEHFNCRYSFSIGLINDLNG